MEKWRKLYLVKSCLLTRVNMTNEHNRNVLFGLCHGLVLELGVNSLAGKYSRYSYRYDW